MYKFHSRVRYSETGEDRRITIPSIVNYFQDCSTFQSEDLGVGIGYLEEAHKVWMLTHWQIVIEEKIELGQEIDIGTWAYDFDKLYGYRNFCMNNKQGNSCVKANSKWILFDLDKGRPTKVTEEDTAIYGTYEKIQMSYTDKKIRVPKEYTQYAAFPVRHCHLDTNGHVNNCQYIQMALEYCDTKREITEVIAEYKQQAVLGNIIKPYVFEDARNNNCTVALVNQDGSVVHVIIEFTYRI